MKGYKPEANRLNFNNSKIEAEYIRRLSEGTLDPVRCMDGTIFIENGPDDWVAQETYLNQ